MKEINKHPNYFVTEDGRIFSNKSGNMFERKLYTNKDGYKTVNLYTNGKYKLYLVHRLVAGAFIINPDNLPYVLHSDDNPANNNVTNLRWGSQLDNYKDALFRKRTKHPCRDIICLETGEIFRSQRQAAIIMEVHQGSIGRCLRGLRKTTKGYTWAYL